METKQLIEKFFESGNLAIIGATDNPVRFGSKVFEELKPKGFNLFPVNRNKKNLNGDRCYSSVSELPSFVQDAVFIIKPSETNKVVHELPSTGIKRVWMQSGSESSEAIEFCRQNNIAVIHNKCVMMYAPPVKHFHKFHRTIWKVIGKL